jgi:tetratricopeptide (TPR) repeat protein
MIEFFDFLSGGVPGGIIVLIFLIVAFIIFFRLLKASEIISAKQSNKQQIIVSIVLIFAYITLWFALRPPLPPQRIVILPSRNLNDIIQLDDAAFKLPELIQQYAQSNLNEKYILHRWEWLLETVGSDSVKKYSAWLRTAKNLGVVYIIESKLKNQDIVYEINVNKIDSNMSTENILTASMNFSQIIKDLDRELDFFSDKKIMPSIPVNNYIKAKAFYFLNQYDNSLALIENNVDNDSRVLAAAIYMQKGLQIKFDRVKHQFVKFENPEFKKSKIILNEIIKQDKDWPGVAYIFGKIALREEDYLKADTYLKKAFIDDPTDCRIHLALSYLLPERLAPLGYQNRVEILNRAVFIDPGFSTAVYELAKEYFESGTGTPSGTGTTMALNTMEKFFKIKNDEPRILGLLASVYLRISRIDDAQVLFERLMKMFPDDSDNYYNLGVVYFQKKENAKALDYFLKAIDIDKNLDSYLYAGVIYRELGEKEKSLQYFRERVKRMTGEDDHYAREAMQGIRKVLEEIKSDSINAN